MTLLLQRIFVAGLFLVLAPALPRADDAASSNDSPHLFEDEMIRLELPGNWRIEGEGGEYQLESDAEDIASLLLLPFDSQRTMEERLAAIEEQFLVTGIIRLESSETWPEEGEEVFYRCYRLLGAGSEDPDSGSVLLHQYSFLRAEVPVLLQVETAPEAGTEDTLFSQVFDTLEIRRAPDPFIFEEAE